MKMKKKHTPKQRLYSAWIIFFVGVGQLYFAYGDLTSATGDEIMGSIALIIGLFALGAGIFDFLTQKEYTRNYNAVVPFAEPVSSDRSIISENAELTEQEIDSLKFSKVYAIYNVVGIIGLIAFFSYLFIDRFFNWLIISISIFLFVLIVRNIIHHSKLKSEMRL